MKPPANPHNEPYVDQLNSLLESLHEHDARSMVLTMASFAEDTLELLLIGYLREPKQAKALVNGFNAPLGTFSARIKAAFVLGLILEDGYKTLDILKKIETNSLIIGTVYRLIEKTSQASLISFHPLYWKSMAVMNPALAMLHSRKDLPQKSPIS